MSFEKDLREALEIEKELINAVDFGETKLFHGLEYDVQIVITVEVKYDRQTHKTGNVAIEIGSKEKPAGLSATTAKWYVYSIDYSEQETDMFNNVIDIKRRSWYIAETNKLKAFLREEAKRGLRPIQGGDNKNSTMLIIPLEKFLKVFRKFHEAKL